MRIEKVADGSRFRALSKGGRGSWCSEPNCIEKHGLAPDHEGAEGASRHLSLAFGDSFFFFFVYAVTRSSSSCPRDLRSVVWSIRISLDFAVVEPIRAGRSS